MAPQGTARLGLRRHDELIVGDSNVDEGNVEQLVWQGCELVVREVQFTQMSERPPSLGQSRQLVPVRVQSLKLCTLP